jgi:hypothetical protein
MRRWAIILLTVATAAVHLSFFLRDPKGAMIFLLNALGYLGLLGLLYLGIPALQALHRFVRPLFIGYTALTIVLYIVLSYHAHQWTIPLGPIDKALEVVLIALLWSEGRAKVAGGS